MIQGTGSDVGKSILVAGICRAFYLRGLKVLPFKPQNMSNNAAVTKDGGEIGRAQWLQAFACKADPSVHMNPVLIKPETDSGAQIIVQGKSRGHWQAADYLDKKPKLLEKIIQSYDIICKEADIVIAEGAGSPAEMNLRAGDVANMGFALAVKTPVLLAGDINKGGVIAALIGTYELLPREEKELIKGMIINKFRGDISLFEGGRKIISDHTAWQDIGVVPYLSCVRDLPEEDAVSLEQQRGSSKKTIKIIVIMLPRISNFDDFDPLKNIPDIELIFHPSGSALPMDADVIIIPGTKSTISDLRFLKAQGWDIDLKAFMRQGKMILGICGGYQMLGTVVCDPEGIEGFAGEEEALGLLDVKTILTPEKQLRHCTAHIAGQDITATGYEIHAGQTELLQGEQAFMISEGRIIGAKKGAVMGTYLHGLFNEGEFLQYFIQQLTGKTHHFTSHMEKIDQALNQLAEDLEESLDLDAILEISRNAVL